MRLTLRTMLAYLDDVLDPADAAVLGKKIDESEFASGLVARIKGVLKKLRMDAPKLDGKGMGNDANTVAEYLDSSLPQDRVGEFERVCLESDKHLCEVAACHQVLTLVLGKPADVPVGLRERIYALGDPSHVAHRDPVEEAGIAARTGPPPVVGGNGRPAAEVAAPLEVPEYLRSGRQSSLWPLALAAAAALLLALIGWWALGPMFNRTTTVATNPNELNHDEAISGKKVGEGEEKVEAADAKAAASAEATTTPSDSVVASSDAAKSESPAAAVAVVPAPETTAENASPPAPAPAAETTQKLAAAAPIPPAAAGAISETPDAPTPIPPAPAVAVAPKGPKNRPPVAAAKTPPVEVGRYLSDEQLLARLDTDDGLWYPKQAQEVITSGEWLVVLPPYRPQVALPSAVQLTFAGEGIVRMAKPSEDRTPRMLVECGRFMASTAGKAGALVELDLVGIKGIVTLIDADSALAIKATRWLPPGTDPEAAPGMPVIEMYNMNGRASWQQADRDKVTIPTHHVHVYVGDDAPETHGPFMPPDWTDARSVKPIDRDAAIVLERLIDLERPLGLSLLEVMKDRRVEVRALAARCLAAVGDFEPILRELSSANQYSFWPGEFDTLRHALNHSPQTAAKVRETLNLLRAADAKDLYRLLWGFSEEQLEKGAASQLVRYLESEQMDVRVLAYLNLSAITGASNFYRPERPPAQMRVAIQNWNERKDKGTIVYRMPPSPLDTYKPMAAPATEQGADAAGRGRK